MINVQQLELHNFLSHVSTAIDLSCHKGLVLIEGKTSDGHYSSNGAGKSSILEGIVYALTGDTLRGVSVNDVVNRNSKKNTRVSLSFNKGSSRYSVDRYRKDDKFGDSIFLHRDGEDISKRVNKETQKSLEDILGISYKVLVSTMLLGEGLSSRFTQLSDPEKKSLIESTLNLNYDLAKIRESANEELKRLSREIAMLEGEIKVLESYEETDITFLEDSIKDNESCIDIYEKTAAHLKEECDTLSVEVDSIHPKLKLIMGAINQYDTQAQKYTELMQSNAHYQAERDAVSKGETPICSMCRQTLQSAESKQAVIQSYQDKINENLTMMSQIEEELNKLPDINSLRSKYDSLSSAYSQKSTEYREKLQEYNGYQVKIADAKKDIEITNSIISNSAENHKQLESKLSEHKTLSVEKDKYDYFYKLFSPTGIIVNILSDAIEYINTRLATYSEILLEKDYRINFLKGKISLVDSKGSNYQSLSNGEKRRLDIAIQFSLHDYVSMYCGVKMDTLFVDEILDTLDDIGVDNIFDVLRLKLEYCGLHSIYVITHNNSLKSKFDQVITVSKNADGNSKII